MKINDIKKLKILEINFLFYKVFIKEPFIALTFNTN